MTLVFSFGKLRRVLHVRKASCVEGEGTSEIPIAMMDTELLSRTEGKELSKWKSGAQQTSDIPLLVRPQPVKNIMAGQHSGVSHSVKNLSETKKKTKVFSVRSGGDGYNDESEKCIFMSNKVSAEHPVLQSVFRDQPLAKTPKPRSGVRNFNEGARNTHESSKHCAWTTCQIQLAPPAPIPNQQVPLLPNLNPNPQKTHRRSGTLSNPGRPHPRLSTTNTQDVFKSASGFASQKCMTVHGSDSMNPVTTPSSQERTLPRRQGDTPSIQVDHDASLSRRNAEKKLSISTREASPVERSAKSSNKGHSKPPVGRAKSMPQDSRILSKLQTQPSRSAIIYMPRQRSSRNAVRVRFDTNHYLTTTYGIEYDRTPCMSAVSLAGPAKMRLYVELMQYKLTEMKIHYESLDNINLHMANVTGAQRSEFIRILNDIIHFASERGDPGSVVRSMQLVTHIGGY